MGAYPLTLTLDGTYIGRSTPIIRHLALTVEGLLVSLPSSCEGMLNNKYTTFS